MNSPIIMIGCDLHARSMTLKIAVGTEKSHKMVYANNRKARSEMIAELKKAAEEMGAAQIVLVYEASSLGYGLYDELMEAGITCYILASTRIEKSVKSRKAKTDDKDAEKLLEILRGHYLAGNKLPSIWVPDKQTRDDRELVRARLDVSDKAARLKTQIKMLLLRHGIEKPKDVSGWSKTFIEWLARLAGEGSELGAGSKTALQSLLEQLRFMEEQISGLTQSVKSLSNGVKYKKTVNALTSLAGVGLITAMVFLSEIGELRRFNNRRQIGSYTGLVPSTYESGETSDRKGRITRQGPWRLRKILNQASWVRVNCDNAEQSVFQRIVSRNPGRRKKGIVAVMRRLVIRMWHIGIDTGFEGGVRSDMPSEAV